MPRRELCADASAITSMAPGEPVGPTAVDTAQFTDLLTWFTVPTLEIEASSTDHVDLGAASYPPSALLAMLADAWRHRARTPDPSGPPR